MDLITGILYLTLNIYHEARSEDQMAQIAVAHVTLNRSIVRNKSIKEVVFEPYQFSWTVQLDNYIPKDIKALGKCFESALISLKGIDFTGGATYYHHKNISPYWADSYDYVGSFGVHKFYK